MGQQRGVERTVLRKGARATSTCVASVTFTGGLLCTFRVARVWNKCSYLCLLKIFMMIPILFPNGLLYMEWDEREEHKVRKRRSSSREKAQGGKRETYRVSCNSDVRFILA